MLLRVGVISMSFTVMLALVLVAILTLRDRTEEVVAAEPAAAGPESTTEQAYQDPRDKMLDLPDPEPEPEPAHRNPHPNRNQSQPSNRTLNRHPS